MQGYAFAGCGRSLADRRLHESVASALRLHTSVLRMVLGTFISALREGNAKHQKKLVAEARAETSEDVVVVQHGHMRVPCAKCAKQGASAEMTVTGLIEMFEVPFLVSSHTVTPLAWLAECNSSFME